jgi:hypothetical protein
MGGPDSGGSDEIVKEICSLMKANPDPEYIRSHLSEKARSRLSGSMQERRIKQTLDVLALLNREGVVYAVLKGVSLSVYERGREFTDLDILVDRGNVESVAELLIMRFGYRYERQEELRLLKISDQDNAHDLSLVSEGRIPVEIHYRLFNYMPTPGLPLLADKTSLEMDGIRFPCPKIEIQLLEVVLHNAYHHAFLCDTGKWIRDINLLVRNNRIDWEEFTDILTHLRQTELVYLTFRRLGGSGKLAIPASVIARLRPRSRLSYLKKPVFIWVLRFIWDRLFPPKDILQDRTGISPSSWLFPLAYPLNWARLLIALVRMPFKR